MAAVIVCRLGPDPGRSGEAEHRAMLEAALGRKMTGAEFWASGDGPCFDAKEPKAMAADQPAEASDLPG